MKKILSFMMLAFLAVMLGGCNKYDDSDLQRRVAELEKSVKELVNYQNLLQKLNSGQTVISCSRNGEEITLTFSDNSSVTFNVQGPKGDTGAAFTWDDLTDAQKEALRGAQGEPGKSFTWDDLTDEQKEALKGAQGEPGKSFTWDDLTDEQKEALKGAQGEPGKSFTWDDLTDEQKAALMGAQGLPGNDGKTPEFQIESGKWYVRYGADEEWQEVGSALDVSLIKSIVPSGDGTVLFITLADDTMFPIAVGEKKSYSFTLGNGQRKCYTFWESQESFLTGTLSIPYTLTGDLASAEDVKILATVKSFATEYVQTSGAVTIEPIDAKSGNIVLKRLYQAPKAADDDDFLAICPGYNLDLVAYFPDGSAKAQSIKVLTENIRLVEGFEVMDYSNINPVPEMPFYVDADATEFELWYSAQLGEYDYQEYDGDPVYEPVFVTNPTYGANNDMYLRLGTNGNFIDNDFEVVSRTSTWGMSGGKKTLHREFHLTFKCSKNTTGQERRQSITFYGYRQSLFSVRVIQQP